MVTCIKNRNPSRLRFSFKRLIILVFLELIDDFAAKNISGHDEFQLVNKAYLKKNTL